MKNLILKISDSNIAGFQWRWEFYLESERDGSYTLSCRHIVTEDELTTTDPIGRQQDCDDLPSNFDPIRELRDGADIYEALEGMMSEAGYSLGQFYLPQIADEIAKINAVAADGFRCGPELLEKRTEAEDIKKAAEREASLLPFRETIDRYIVRFSDKPLRYPGGATCGTARAWAKRFIEDYVIANGRLPTGEHDIKVRINGGSYSGPAHDFSDLK